MRKAFQQRIAVSSLILAIGVGASYYDEPLATILRCVGAVSIFVFVGAEVVRST